MSATDLRFFKRLPVTTALRFNEAPPPGVDIYSTATIDAAIAVAATPNLTTRVGYLATVDAAVDVGFEANLLAYYDNAVNRSPHLNAAAAWEVADPLAAETAAAHEVSAKAEARARIPLDSALPLSSAIGIDWAGTDRGKRPAVAVPWAEGLHRAAVIRDAWRDLLRQPRPQIVAGFQEGAQAPVFVTDGWQERFRRPPACPRHPERRPKSRDPARSRPRPFPLTPHGILRLASLAQDDRLGPSPAPRRRGRHRFYW